MLRNKEERIKYIEEHLSYDLEWLLRATNSWKLAKEKGDKNFPNGFRNYAEITALTHARSLFEVFTTSEEKIEKKRKQGYITWNDFGLSEHLISTKYRDHWSDLIHQFLMHNKERLPNKKTINNKGLWDLVPEFSEEILRLWDELIDKADTGYKEALISGRNKAINHAKRVLRDPFLEGI